MYNIYIYIYIYICIYINNITYIYIYIYIYIYKIYMFIYIFMLKLSIYIKIPFEKIIKAGLKKVRDSRDISKNTLDYFLVNPKLGRFSLLPKIHKRLPVISRATLYIQVRMFQPPLSFTLNPLTPISTFMQLLVIYTTQKNPYHTVRPCVLIGFAQRINFLIRGVMI